MSKSAEQRYDRRLETLKRRRDYLDKRINDYKGTNDSRDKAEASALHWAIGVVESHYDDAVDAIRTEDAAKEVEQ